MASIEVRKSSICLYITSIFLQFITQHFSHSSSYAPRAPTPLPSAPRPNSETIPKINQFFFFYNTLITSALFHACGGDPQSRFSSDVSKKQFLLPGEQKNDVIEKIRVVFTSVDEYRVEDRLCCLKVNLCKKNSILEATVQCLTRGEIFLCI